MTTGSPSPESTVTTELVAKKSAFISSHGSSSIEYSHWSWLLPPAIGLAVNFVSSLSDWAASGLKPLTNSTSVGLKHGIRPISVAAAGNFTSITSNLSPYLCMFNFKLSFSMESKPPAPPKTYKDSPIVIPVALWRAKFNAGIDCHISAFTLYFSQDFKGLPKQLTPPKA